MSLVEIARFTDVYEADLAAAFLRSHDLDVHVSERFQTTVDPLMQRALGIRLMVAAPAAAEARALLARAQAGEFATDEGDDLPERDMGTRVAGTFLALATFSIGAFWGSSTLPRRFRPVPLAGLLFAAIAVTAALLAFSAFVQVLLNPP